jgi:hypothetical protein
VSADRKPAALRRRGDFAIGGAALLMVLCCAVGPAVIGAAAGSVIGGWLGVACAVVLAGVIGLVMHRRSRRNGQSGC